MRALCVLIVASMLVTACSAMPRRTAAPGVAPVAPVTAASVTVATPGVAVPRLPLRSAGASLLVGAPEPPSRGARSGGDAIIALSSGRLVAGFGDTGPGSDPVTAASRGVGIEVSDDRSGSWRTVLTGAAVTSFAQDDGELVALTGRQMLRSSDGGSHWTRGPLGGIETGTGYSRTLDRPRRVSLAAGGVLLATGDEELIDTASPPGLIRSTDDGAHWRQVRLGGAGLPRR